MSSNRGTDWDYFSELVFRHIEDYTVPQYGDYPDDQLTAWCPEDCIIQIRRYANRFGRNARGKEEQLRDLLKIAHYAQIAHSKLLDDKENS